MNPLCVFMSYYMILTERSHVLLLWLPGHKGIEGNNISEKLAKTSSLPHL
jgi:ribonuclease HI